MDGAGRRLAAVALRGKPLTDQAAEQLAAGGFTSGYISLDADAAPAAALEIGRTLSRAGIAPYWVRGPQGVKDWGELLARAGRRATGRGRRRDDAPVSGPNGKLTEEQVKAEMARLAAGRNGLGPAKNANGQVHDLTTHRQGAAGGSETAAQGANGATGASAAGQEWPTLGQVAFHGLAGRVVRTLDPHTEADPAGLLICFLAAFGNIVGAGPHASADASKHPARLNVLLVGKTAKARKGTAWANIVRPMALADPGWAMECMVSGLSSGEGLIAEVRDPGEDQLAGVPDKRRLVVEAEFAPRAQHDRPGRQHPLRGHPRRLGPRAAPDHDPVRPAPGDRRAHLDPGADHR